MKTYLSIYLLLVMSLSPCIVGAETGVPAVAKGDTMEQVVQKLGPPKGQVSGGRRATYYYDRGTVDFLTGRVERAFIISAQEAKEKIVAREKAEAEMRRQAEVERARLMAEGKAQLEKVLADKAFADSSATARMAYWVDFQKKYPGIDVSAPVANAQKGLETDQKENGKVTELSALNSRAMEIGTRFKQLDADYAASLVNWKRDEIDQERAKLTKELADIKVRVEEMLK